MPSQNVRISAAAHQALRELSEQEGASMQSLLDEAIEELRRAKFLSKTNIAFAALRKNPKAWQQEQKEREVWDNTLNDGVDD